MLRCNDLTRKDHNFAALSFRLGGDEKSCCGPFPMDRSFWGLAVTCDSEIGSRRL